MPHSADVMWNEWEPATFERAAAEGKLVFLDISARWCHWCRVLDGTSLSDPRVVQLLNEAYVPVRVDTDRRPDINERYNQGGWPTTAVLLPNGRMLTGATYLPPDALHALLAKCADFYRRDRDRVDRYMQEHAGRAEETPAKGDGTPPEDPRPGDLALVKRSVQAQFDPDHPGFFKEPKFLATEILGFLRDAWLLEGDREMGDALVRTLRTMGGSGVLDAVEGGFFRYATKRDWTAPHYEKLLADNAEMLSLYASAYGETEEPAFARAAQGILRFLLLKLYDRASGVFFASQDADEEYFPLNASGRALRVPPAVDRTVFSEYNAKAVSALAAAHRAFGVGKERPSEEGGTLIDRAVKAARFLRDRLWDASEGQVRFSEDGRFLAGQLADNVAAATAGLDLYEATGEAGHLEWSGEVLDWTVRHFFSANAFGFLDRRPREGDVGTLTTPLLPFADNARAACALIRCSREAVRPDLFAVAELTLRGLSAEFEKRGAFSAPYGSALLLYWKGRRGTVCLPGDPSCSPGPYGVQ